MADGAFDRVDLLATRDHGRVRPNSERHVSIRVLQRGGYVGVAALVVILFAVGSARRRMRDPEPNDQEY